MSDLFGVAGLELLDRLELPPVARARINSARRVMDCLDSEIDTFTRLAGNRLRGDRGFRAVQTLPGVGPVLGAVLVAEIGDVHRFPNTRTDWRAERRSSSNSSLYSPLT